MQGRPGELSVAPGIDVSTGWYTGSAKFVALAKESDKDREFASFQAAPFGAQFKDKPIELAGVKGKVGGKLSMGPVLKPAWGAIGADVAAGFIAGAAAQVFAHAKSVSEWRDVRDCTQAAENGWRSFRAGFASACGLKWADGGSSELHQQGAATAKALLDARLASARKRVLAERGSLPDGFDAEWRDTMREVAAKNPDGPGMWIQSNFRRGILDGFLRADAQEHADDSMYEQNARALRTLPGIAR